MTDSINLSGLLPHVRNQAQFAALLRDLDGPHDGEVHWPLLRAARAATVAALAPQLDRPLLLIAARPDRAQALYEALRAFALPPDRLWRFPEPTALFYERVAMAARSRRRTTASLSRIG